MSVTVSSRRNWLPGVAWAVFACVNVAVMYVMPGRETIPFHFVWIGLGLVYGLSRWSPTAMISALVAVTISTGLVLAHHADIGAIGWEETAEVPLMAALFLAMVWHVSRRQHALAEVQRLAAMDRRRLEAQQLFVRLCSHELRTPITIARGYTDLVRTAHPDPGLLEDTDIVLEELDKLNRITHRLLTLMQMNESPPLELVDLDGALTRVVHRWEPTADRAWRAESAVGAALVDQERLETALDTLIENAVKFTAPGDVIEVTGRRDGDRIVLTVADSGCGISAEHAAELLTGPAGRRTATGTGLGLAIVRAAVSAATGTLAMAPRPGGGTLVTITLPAASRAASAGASRRHPMPVHGAA